MMMEVSVSRSMTFLTRPISRRTLISSTALAAGLIASDRFQPGASSASAQSELAWFFDRAEIHDIHAVYDEADYQAVIAAYQDTADKQWLLTTMTIDGTELDEVGMRLKGSSSLIALRGDGPPRSIQEGDGTPVAESNAFPDGTPVASTFAILEDGTPVAGEIPAPGNGAFACPPDCDRTVAIGGMSEISADEPEGLPWLVRLNREIADQNLNGMKEFVIRGNNSQTSLNEAVALDLLAVAGLATQQAAYARFSVGARNPRLRLVIENPNDEWMAANFSEYGILFKAESTGDWSYRGDDPASYDDIFDLEAGGNNDDVADFAPLTALLDFINNSDDEAFAAELPSRLDVDRFAVYLAMMNLIANADDIDGPGNNAYLFFDLAAERFTIVPWDMNLAFQPVFFGMQPGPGAAGPGQQQPEFPDGGTTRIDGDDVAQTAHRGLLSNPLVNRFTAVPEWAELIEKTEAQLRSDLYASGLAAEILARWVDLLDTQAREFVSAETIATESAAIAEFFTKA